jgi:prolyl oligopeptidase
MLGNKQNVFDDFISAAEHLVESGLTTPANLGIYGRSNGGLLVTACLLQRPDLFGAVVGMVPVTDMLRYHHFTAGRYWTPEYGNAEENADHFRFLIEYSPLHNAASGTYPPTLITTGDTDDRVVPLHSYKFVAALQRAAGGSGPVLLRVDKRAGHGLGKPTAMVIEEAADIFAFFLHHLGE